MEIYEHSDLPKKYAAINRIMNQPFFGNTKFELPLYVRYEWTHCLWFVGTLKEIASARSQCSEEYIELCNKHPSIFGVSI